MFAVVGYRGGPVGMSLHSRLDDLGSTPVLVGWNLMIVYTRSSLTSGTFIASSLSNAKFALMHTLLSFHHIRCDIAQFVADFLSYLSNVHVKDTQQINVRCPCTILPHASLIVYPLPYASLELTQTD